MNSKEMVGITLLIAGSVMIFLVTSMGSGLVTNVLAGAATLALAGGALAFGTSEDGRPV
ncbi:hypothetical protein [Halomicrococcus sp. NG-SE-24]|uniref:hypothetical protein n=1 Tax=Halomicrococcus sp. NG-SE-24 TaxID=3436928 RepID=UPI003D950E1E